VVSLLNSAAEKEGGFCAHEEYQVKTFLKRKKKRRDLSLDDENYVEKYG